MMKTKNFFLTAALVVATALTGTMMTSCSKIDIPVADNDGNPPLPKGKIVNLSALSADYVAVGGDTLTGLLDGSKQPYMISIADGATVTLSDATIQRDNTKNYSWAGITCLGDATIILDGENSVEEFYRDYPGIQPGPEGTTLTIKGEGKLTASSLGAAGIGSGCDMTCGNITIESGIVTATGGENSAGIGSGCAYMGSVCGDITITGGTVVATGKGGAGIGSGNGFDGANICGNITITGGIVTATGNNHGAGIGSGEFGICGDITISGGTVVATGEGFGTGIGCGGGSSHRPSVCGDITIKKGKGFVSVTAIRGGDAKKPIGVSSLNEENNICGIINFNGNNVNGLEFFYYNPQEGNYGGLILTISSSDPDDPEKGDTWTLTQQ